MASVFKLGKGTICRVAMMNEGSEVYPDALTLTTEANVTAKDVTGGATITLSAAIAANKQPIPTGTYLGFVAPTTGKVVVVQLTAPAESADTTLSVAQVPEAIAASSVCLYPLRLSGRTAANIGRDGNRIESVDFDSGGFATGLTASVSGTIELPGNFLPTDAGFLTAEYAFTNLREVYVEIELTPISAAYSTGKVYKGRASITSLPVEVPADGIITGNISLAINGELVQVADVAAA